MVLALAIGGTIAAPAAAQCAPEPAPASGTTTCTGTDGDGVRVTTPGTTLNVAVDATVSHAGAPAITVDVPNAGFAAGTTVVVAGRVSGGAQSGIALLTGAAGPFGGGTTRLALTIAGGGVLSGSSALTMAQSPGNGSGQLLATIDNGGTINGAGGVALRGDVAATSNGFVTSYSAFASIVNRPGAIINGSIVGPVGTLTNAGLIDGGAPGALANGNAGTSYPFTISPGAWSNTGTIRSNGAAATITSSTIGSLTNTGTIANAGSGAALSGSSLGVQNSGEISSAGVVAVSASGAVSLVNRGTITGSVVAGNVASTIDSSRGRINGSVSLGSGNDTLVVRYDGTATPVTGINGTINAGGGTNTQVVAVANDTTIATPVTLLPGFQQLAITTDAGATTVLGAGFVAPASAVQVLGAGTLVNRAAVSTAGPAFTIGGSSSPASQRFVNQGEIRTSATAAFAVNAGFAGFAQINNAGTIISAGGGISSSQAAVVNGGTISTGTTGVAISGNGLTNSGTIRSGGGIGAQLSGNVGTASTNSGIIQGASAGVQTSGYLTNTGTITATGSGGTAVRLDAYGVLFNNAGGVVGNGGQAVTGTSFNQTVVNAGTINGSVSLSSSFQSGNSQRYISQGAGVLNGNLALGADGLLFTDLANNGPGQFAGITGTVTAASGAALRYRVTGVQSATIGPVGPFAIAAYELTGSAALTLTAPATITRQLVLAGTGSVDINADLAASTAAAALAVTSPLATLASTGTPPGALAITSRGTIAVTRAGNGAFLAATGVTLGGGDRFTNAGTITVTDRNAGGASIGIVAQSGGTIVNAGSILLDGGIGVSGSTLTNTGTITQVQGGATARGVIGARLLNNSGTIRTGGIAVTASNSGQVVNTGTIASTGGVAIGGTDTSASATITNAAGGTITGTGGTAVRLYQGSFTNAGTVTGTVDLGFAFPFFAGTPPRSFASSRFVAAGGTIEGDLLFGDGADLLLQTGDALGVSGTIDGGAGRDIYGRSLGASGTAAIDPAGIRNFEDALVAARGPGTVATVVAATPFAGNLYVAGDGAIVNQASVAGALTTTLPFSLASPFAIDPLFPADQILTAITNAGSVAGGASVATMSFTNAGTVGTTTLARTAAAVSADGAMTFANGGTIANDGSIVAVNLRGVAITATNSGTIAGGLDAMGFAYPGTPAIPAVSLANTGSITARDTAVLLSSYNGGDQPGGTVDLDNAGTVEATGAAGTAVFLLNYDQDAAPEAVTIALTNAGTIRANAGGRAIPADPYAGAAPVTGSDPAGAVSIAAPSGTTRITNAATGTIEATGALSTAVFTYGAIDLANAGTIRGGAGTALAAGDTLGRAIGAPYLAGAVQTQGAFEDRIANTGTIIGSIALGGGNDRIENRGRIEGDVFLGAGDDTFLHRASATLTGIVDGGTGTDSFLVDATEGGSLAGDRLVNFERLSQSGPGDVAYEGTFRVDAIELAGGAITVRAGGSLATLGPVAIIGSGAGETVTNAGTIAGSIALGGGNDGVVNTGTVNGTVLLGDGDDAFTEGPGSRAVGGADGGTGDDLYIAMLAGDRTGLGARTGFERLAVTGSGTLTLTLDQDFAATGLVGAGLDATLAGRSLGMVTGSDDAEALGVDGDVAQALLGGGDDVLALGTARATGRYDGGAGNDTLRFTAAGAVTLAGTASGFEQLTLTGGALTVAGTLGSTGTSLAFGAGDQQLTVAGGGVLSGAVDLGAGRDGLRIAAGGTISGTVAGGSGIDVATIELGGARTLGAGTLSGFETLATEGSGSLTLTGAHAYDLVASAGDLGIAAGAALTAPQVRFAARDDRFTIAGRFTGSVDGAAGNDAIAVSGGSEATPVAFGSVANVEAFLMSGGFATIAGSAALGSIDLSGGRLVGLAGSTIGASLVTVRQGATFGSAGTITGNLAVAGILSPGASPGTMTVNGNVAIQSGSVSLFEIAPTMADRLVVSGAVTIAPGATLQLVPSGTLTPGASYDLIVAGGGITGSYSTVVKPDTLFGFVVQRVDRIQLLGQFLGNAAFSPQVAGSIAYANATLAAQPPASRLFAVLPALLGPGGGSNPAAFARLTPEPYASASQLGTDHALALVGAARGTGFAATGSEARLYTFGEAIGGWHRLGADPAAGTAAARSRRYGALGGIGFGHAGWNVGGFAGYLDDRQRIGALDARTRVDGLVAGIHARYAAPRGLGITASVIYDDGRARTDRALPVGGAAAGRYDLHSLVSDVSATYAIDAGDWTLRPRIGVTYLRTTRTGVEETGGSPFALAVAPDRHVAGFADAGLLFGRADASPAPFRPWVSLGMRHQIEGTRAEARAGYAGGGFGLTAFGASRSRVVGTAAAGVGYRLPSGVDVFATASGQSGRDDHQESITAGVRLRF